MIGVHEDTDADGDADGSDLWFYPAYDPGWREVARYREGDSSPKEQFVNATAGLDGYGGSSYINDVVCRDRDNTGGWLAASDGTLEERYYLCANWRGDHSALVTSDRKLHEMVKYSPYGVPFGLPGGDANSDGDNDAADATQIQAWIDAAAYDVRGDVDLDGDVDSTDKTLAQGVPINGNTLGRGSSSDAAFRNQRHFGGYKTTQAALHCRRRSLLLLQGRWNQRDPRAYLDSMNLNEYAESRPLTMRDAMGLSVGCPPRDCLVVHFEADVDIDGLNVQCLPDCVVEDILEERVEDRLENSRSDEELPDPCGRLMVGGMTKCVCDDPSGGTEEQIIPRTCASAESINDAIDLLNDSIDLLNDMTGSDIPNIPNISLGGRFRGLNVDWSGARVCIAMKKITKNGHCKRR